MTRAGEGRHGFTLIELLVSLTIFSIIAVAVYSAFAGGVGAWRRAQEFSSTYQTARLVLDDMAHELKNAVTLSGPDLIGEKQGLPFLTDKVGAREGDGILELVRHIVQDEARRLIGRAEFLGSPPGADATGKRRIDGDRDDGEYGQAHQELDEGEAVPPFSRSRHLTPVSSTSRRRWLAAVPAEPMKP